jgi:hypothetical protein
VPPRQRTTKPGRARTKAPKPRTSGDSHLSLSPRATNIVMDAMREHRKNYESGDPDRDIIDAVISELQETN